MLDNIITLDESIGDLIAADEFLQHTMTKEKLFFYKDFIDRIRSSQETK